MTIGDDAAIITVTASDAVVSELGPDTGTFTFTRSGGNISAALAPVFVTKDGTTTVGGADYSDNNGGFFKSLNQVSIPAGSTSLTWSSPQRPTISPKAMSSWILRLSQMLLTWLEHPIQPV